MSKSYFYYRYPKGYRISTKEVKMLAILTFLEVIDGEIAYPFSKSVCVTLEDDTCEYR
jgi:hypothetical protein